MTQLASPARELLNVREACEWLGCSRATLYRILARGELQPLYVGSRPRFRVSALEDYLAGQQPAPEIETGPLADYVRERGYWMSDEALTENLIARGAGEAEIPALLKLADPIREREWGETG